MSYVLQSKVGGEFRPHPEGIHPAVCVDLIDLGLMETEWQGERRMVNKLRLVFETEQRGEDGRNCTVSKTFTASLHPKSKLADFVGKWRGRPVVPGESIDLSKLIGASCTLIISHQQNMAGRTYASIDAVSKPTKRVTPSGSYDPALARQRIAEWKAKEAGQIAPGATRQAAPASPAPYRAPSVSVEQEKLAGINEAAAAFAKADKASGSVPAAPAAGAQAQPEFDDVPF